MRTSLLLLGATATIAGASLAPAASAAPTTGTIPGYTYGSPKLAHSPVTLADFEKLKEAALFTDEDILYLHKAGAIMVPQTDAILDVWYGFVGGHPHLAYYFGNPKTGKLDAVYLSRVRARFGRWIKDTTDANYDQTWLDYQYEIGLRHNVVGKNKTDKVKSVPQINYRYLPAFIVPITATVEPFLDKSNASPEEVAKMMAAWNKAVTLQVILWTQPYIKPGQF